MSWEIRQGDALDLLREMPDESVQTCVTSPPYWGLRDYGTAEWQGGDPGCDHGERRWDGPKQTQGAMSGHAAKSDRLDRQECRCGATRKDAQLGLEPTPEQYVENMVAVFREVRRALRDDGTLWLNLGDSYWSAKGTPGGEKAWHDGSNADEKNPARRFGKRPQDGPPPDGIKPKDLVGIPWMVAFALRADGWYLRSDVIWAKPNPMPESVTDRPTKAHEYLFLLAKSRAYFYDSAAIREGFADARLGDPGSYNRTPAPERSGIGGDRHDHGFVENGGGWDRGAENGGRNKRSVWEIATRPYPAAHFATFPPALVEPCILAGSAAGDTVLDPFAGAATTGLVAARHNRDFIGIELNPEYVELGRNRIRDDAPLLNVSAEMGSIEPGGSGRAVEGSCSPPERQGTLGVAG